MVEAIALTISALALVVSGATAWLTLFRRGTIKMTQPTVIYFGPDALGSRHGKTHKVYLRTLLFSTSKRGRVIESMHVAVSRIETHQNFSIQNFNTQNFNIWVYGDEKLVRGSGLFVGETGVAASHHFLTPKDGNSFRFTEGRYRIEVFAHLLGDQNRTALFSQTLEVTRELAAKLEEPGTGLYFDWGPDAAGYLPHIDKRSPSLDPEELIERLGLIARAPEADAKMDTG